MPFTKYTDRITISRIRWSWQKLGCKPNRKDCASESFITEVVPCVLQVLFIYLFISHYKMSFLLCHISIIFWIVTGTSSWSQPTMDCKFRDHEQKGTEKKKKKMWTTTTKNLSNVVYVSCISQWHDWTNTINLQILVLLIWQQIDQTLYISGRWLSLHVPGSELQFWILNIQVQKNDEIHISYLKSWHGAGKGQYVTMLIFVKLAQKAPKARVFNNTKAFWII